MLTAVVSGAFLTRQRLRLWSVALLIAAVITIVFLTATAHGLTDFKGRPLGSDFSGLYAASSLAKEGRALAAYNPAAEYAREQALFGPGTPFYGWQYPPFVFPFLQPLAHLPYLAAFLVWQVLTLAAYLLAMRTLLRNGSAPALASDPLWLLLALAFPAVLTNITHGQNGFLSAALIAGGLALLDKRPIVAGVLFGLMAFKPQFGVLLPVALMAAGRWRTVAAAACVVIGLIVVATLCYGAEGWNAFLASAQFSRLVVLENGAAGFAKLQSVFAAVRLAGGPVAVAYGLQLAVTLSVAAAVGWLWRGSAAPTTKGALLCLGALLATPYCFDYDLMLLAPAIALLTSGGWVRGLRPGEALILSALWLVPMGAREFANATHLALTPVLIGLTFVLLLRRPDRVAR